MKLLAVEDYKKALYSTTTGELCIQKGSERRAINSGYHLAIGDGVSYLRGNVSPVNGKITISPNETIVFKSKEYFLVPNNCCGFAINRVWDSVRQLRIDSTFIDPGYEGKLHIIVTNYGKQSLTLSVDEPLLKIVMFYTDNVVNKAAISTNRNDIDIYLNRIAEDIERNLKEAEEKERKEDEEKERKRKKTWITYMGVVLLISSIIVYILYFSLSLDNFIKTIPVIVSILIAAIISPISAFFMVKK